MDWYPLYNSLRIAAISYESSRYSFPGGILGGATYIAKNCPGW